ncbi:hypothetical protein ACFX19_043836 [Malus domestica]
MRWWFGNDGCERDVAIDSKNLGFAADVAEPVVLQAREEPSAVAAHELGLVILGLSLSCMQPLLFSLPLSLTTIFPALWSSPYSKSGFPRRPTSTLIFEE